MRVLICGNYGRPSTYVNGQTLKTRTLTDALVRVLGEDAVDVLDTTSILREPLAFYSTARKHIKQCTHVLILPGQRALRVLLPLFLKWRTDYGMDLRYVVVGGWLPELLGSRRRLRRLCMKLDGIYVETQSMADRMCDLGIPNVHVLSNFRFFERRTTPSRVARRPGLRLVFCARVVKEKGIEEAIAALERLQAQMQGRSISLDVYGPVPNSYEKHFRDLVDRSPTTTYKGVLSPSDMHEVLEQYDLMLFPTYYAGEGFPGTIIDSFIAGLPVLASDWKYNAEIIDHGRTGAICRARSTDDLTETLSRYAHSPQLLADMRMHCVERAQDFHVDRVLKKLLVDMGAQSPSGSSEPEQSQGADN
jgi:glycosyltransferase involved in cell wall biosynthesis